VFFHTTASLPLAGKFSLNSGQFYFASYEDIATQKATQSHTNELICYSGGSLLTLSSDTWSYDYTVELKLNKILSLSLILAVLQLQH